MKVGLVIYGSLDTLSGGYLYDRMLVAQLKAQGDAVEIINLPWRSYRAHLIDNLNAVFRDQMQRPFDLLLQDELNHPSLFLLNRRLPDQPAPIVSIVHHLRCTEARPDWQNWLYRQIERRYLETVDAFLFNSQTTRQTVFTIQPKTAQAPNLVAYPGGDRLKPEVDEAAIRKRACTDGPLRIFFLGNVIPRKGLHVLLDAFHRLEAEGPGRWQLEVAGGLTFAPGYVQALRRRIAKAGWQERIQFLGPISDQELRARLEQNHVLALPSSQEGFGIAYLEAMGFGLPAVATTGGAAGEYIIHGENGYLIKPGDRAALARCLLALQTDRKNLAEMGIRARRSYLAHPTWSESMGQAVRFLHSLAAARKDTQ